MSDALKRIEVLQAQRAQLNADIDREIEGLKEKALQELTALRDKLSSFEKLLLPVSVQAIKRVPTSASRAELDETDAGNGIREIEENTSAESFKDELAALRERTQEKRRRLG